MDELNDQYLSLLEMASSIEDTLMQHLPQVAALAQSDDLRRALHGHLEQTREHQERVRELLARQGRAATMEDAAFEQMMEHAGQMMEKAPEGPARDALIIAAARRAEHNEIAIYTALYDWADKLGDTESHSLIEKILGDELAAEKSLGVLAEGSLLKTGIDAKAAQ